MSQSILGAPGPLDLVTDRVADIRTISFAPGETGYLYVFDVPRYTGSGKPNHGELVDLADAPSLFAQSPRIRAQYACLIAADPEVNGGDLSMFQVCAPIAVGRPMVGSMVETLRTHDLFPPPDVDSWYARLVTLPLVNRYDTQSQKLVLTQPFPSRYMAGIQNRCGRLGHCVISLPPALLWPYLLHEAPREGWLPQGFAPNPVSSAILLELPAFKLMPPLEGGGWNHAVASSGLPEAATVVDHNDRAVGNAPLAQVFVEFTPLELDDWRDVEATEHDTHRFVRGAYPEHSRGLFGLWIVEQTFPSCQMTISGRYEFELDTAQRRLVVRGSSGTAPLVAVPIPGKVLLTLLTLLRDLSSGPIACPFPDLRAEDQGPALIRIQGNGTVGLLRVGEQYVMRDLRRHAAFAGTNTSLRITMIDGRHWEQIDEADVQRAVFDLTRRERGA